MAMPKIAHSSIEQRAARGRKAGEQTPVLRPNLRMDPGPRARDSGTFDRSITDFSQRYADQNEQDFQQFVKAVRTGRLKALEGV